MSITIKHRIVWDTRIGDYSKVTDIITPDGASRIAGHQSAGVAAHMLARARRQME